MYFDKMTTEQISQTLGLAEGTVKSRLRRREKISSLRRYVKRYKYKTKFRRPVEDALKGSSRDLQEADRIINSGRVDSERSAIRQINRAKDVLDDTYHKLKSLKRRIKEDKKK